MEYALEILQPDLIYKMAYYHTFLPFLQLFLKQIKIMAISDVQQKGSWYYIIDSSEKKTATIVSSLGELKGIGIDFIVLERGCWYYPYDEKGKKIGTLVNSSGEFNNAAGNTFILKKGSWIYKFDKFCKKTGTRVA
jgi:glucan-binding YG repeat protein